MRLPNTVLNCACFLAHDTLPQVQYRGTAFVVGIAGKNNNHFLHLVTAAHVAEKLQFTPFVIGMNLKQGGKVIVRAGADFKWWYHPSEKTSVDAAVGIFATPNVSDYSLEYVPERMFATEDRIKDHDIGVGDELNVVGLFTRFSGTSQHHPVVRTGNIAMMPTDRIPVSGFEPMRAYLAEGRSIGGLSGSPVFVRDTLNTPAVDKIGKQRFVLGLGSLYFLGLMHGHWETPLDFKASEQAEAVNMGISIVVPATKILEVLHQPDLIALRGRFDERIAKEKAP